MLQGFSNLSGGNILSVFVLYINDYINDIKHLDANLSLDERFHF